MISLKLALLKIQQFSLTCGANLVLELDPHLPAVAPYIIRHLRNLYTVMFRSNSGQNKNTDKISRRFGVSNEVACYASQRRRKITCLGSY
jgi:hypothetical protein